jgi:hypothetical protein
MGPIALFDKSFLQSLSVDESVWFDQFFMPVVCPIFYTETLADLAKSGSAKLSAESAVRVISSKFPEFGCKPVRHHRDLCLNDLMGHRIPMNSTIPMSGGRQVQHGSKAGVVFEESPEAAAFGRWRDENFYELERDFAKEWRQSLASLDLKEIARSFKSFGIEGKRFNSLEEIKAATDEMVNSIDKRYDMMHLAEVISGLPRSLHEKLFQQWAHFNKPPLAKYAPYAAHVVSVEIFFQLAINSDLISAERNSNRMDIAYLFYLPFCMTFISSDNLHRKCAPLFMRNDQSFTWGMDLKNALKRLNEHYLMLPEAVRNLGIHSFASDPPKDVDNLVAKIWDDHLPAWRVKEESPPLSEFRENKKLIEHLKGFTKAPSMPANSPILDHDEIEMMSVEYRVSRKKGSWYQIPKDLEINDDEE